MRFRLLLSGVLAALIVALTGISTQAVASTGATASALTQSQARQKQIELRKCNRKTTRQQRRRCKKRVNNKYQKISEQNSAPKGATKLVKLGDDFFAPSIVDLKVNDSINWSWADIGGFEPHNVTLATGPSGVSRNDFVSQTTAVTSYSFKRTFTKPGSYSFVCSLHSGMTMNVTVSN